VVIKVHFILYKKIPISLYLCLSVLCAAQSAIAQQNTQLDKLLNTVDSQSDWSKIPVSGAQVQTTAPAKANVTANQPQYFAQPNNALYARQQLLRALLGGSPQANSSADSKANWSSSSAYSDWQEAENQASRAHDAESRASYSKEKWAKQDDASTAYYASEAARAASDRVYQASLAGDPTAKQYASKARAAADRARADSDQARYYADTARE